MFDIFRTPPRVPPPSHLDVAEQRARIDKLNAESKLLSLQLSPRAQRYERLKVIAGIGGLATGIAAVLGLAFSGYQFFESAESTRKVRVEERLDRALSLMGGDNASGRLAAVVSLNSFLRGDEPDHVNQVLQAFTNALALEQSVTVRNAIVASLEALDVSSLDSASRDRALQSLVLVSRGLVQEGDLWRGRRDNPYSAPPHDSVESRAVSVAAAIATMLRKGARVKDMSRIYLTSADLRRLDLQGVVFDDAILAWTDFSEANLQNASFNDADLERTLFIGVHAVRASFTASTDDTIANRHFVYVEEQMNRTSRRRREAQITGQYFSVEGPDFTCANLREADFSGHPLIPVYPNTANRHIQVFGLSFRKTDLAKAKLSPSRAFGLAPVGGDSGGPFPITDGGGSFGAGDVFMQTEALLDSRAPLSREHDDYSEALSNLGYIFAESTWETAALDASVRQALTMANVPNRPYTKPCRPR